MAPTKDSKTCLGCSTVFKKSDYSLQCTVCGLWSHKTCAGATDEMFSFLEGQMKATGRSYWACKPCQVYAEGMNHRLKQMEERIDRVEKLSEATAQETKTVNDRVQALEKAVTSRETEIDKKIRNEELSIYEELREREARKLNVVIHEVGECDKEGASGLERKEWDLASCENIFEKMGNKHDRKNIKFIRRVGQAGNGARPLVVGQHKETSPGRNEGAEGYLLQGHQDCTGPDQETERRGGQAEN